MIGISASASVLRDYSYPPPAEIAQIESEERSFQQDSFYRADIEHDRAAYFRFIRRLALLDKALKHPCLLRTLKIGGGCADKSAEKQWGEGLEGLRPHLFSLQALARIYEELYAWKAEKEDKKSKEESYKDSRKIFGKLLEMTKELEDAVGAYDQWYTFQRFAAEIGATEKPEVREKFHEEVTKAAGAAERILKKTWLDGSRPKGVKTFLRELNRVDWFSDENDSHHVTKTLEGMLRKISQKEYDFNELQTGIHEFRRQARWVSIYIQSLSGLIDFKTERSGMTGEREDLIRESRSYASKFLQIYRSARDRALSNRAFVSFPYYSGLTRLVSAFGDLKDAGEFIEFIAETMVHTGVAADLKSAVPEVNALVIAAIEKAERNNDYEVKNGRKVLRSKGLRLIRQELLADDAWDGSQRGLVKLLGSKAQKLVNSILIGENWRGRNWSGQGWSGRKDLFTLFADELDEAHKAMEH